MRTSARPRWALGLFLALAPLAVAGERTGVEGVVLDDAGRPVVGAVVRVADTEARTDGRGRFVATVPAGTHPVVVRGPDGVEHALPSLRVEEGYTSELLVSWGERGAAPWIQVEEPPAGVGDAADVEVAVPLRVRVVGDSDGAPLAGVRVYVRGLAAEALTGGDGTVTLDVTPGTWDVAALGRGFAARTLSGVEVGNEPVDVEMRMLPAGLALEVYQVRAPRIEGNTAALLDERREGSTVAEVLGAEQMARSGDNNAAAALRRVTGLTVVDGRYVYVRGLGERYSSTLLNGGQLPSPEPERRVVPLDLFPSMVLESVVVQKTYTPDLPGEFGGGVVQLRTLPFPRGPVIEVQLQGGARGGTSFQEGLGYAGGPLDALGVDGGARALPPDVAAASADQPLKEGNRFSDVGYTPDELQAFGRSMGQVWTPTGRVLPPDWSVALALGQRWNPGGRPLGALLALSYGDGWLDQDYRSAQYNFAAGGVTPDTDYAVRRTERRVRLSGLLTVGGEPAEGQRLQSSTLVLRNTEDEARTVEGFLPEESADVRGTRLRWVERMLVVEQLVGSHALARGEHPVRLDWRYAFAGATRLEPDRRETRYDELPDGSAFALSRRDGDANQRFFSVLGDATHDAALDLSIPVVRAGRSLAVVKLGGNVVQRDRDVDTRRFTFTAREAPPDDVRVLPLEEILVPDRIGPDGFQLKEVTLATDNYTATQTIAAGYAMATVTPLPWLDVLAGARVEHGRQRVVTQELFNPDGVPVVSELVNTDVLPAAALTFKPRDDLRLRLGYGRTLSRPESRELSPATFRDVVGGRDQYGNPELQRALIDHGDVRLEWFPTRGDVLAVSGFVKAFQQPVEQLVRVGADESITWANALGATNWGVEGEVLKHLEFVSPSLEDVYLSVNAAFVDSRIVLDPAQGGVQTNDARPLQGQSPWTVNAQIGFDDPDLGLNAAILYNVFGPRLDSVGTFGLPDTYEQPFHSLDVVVNAKLPRGFDLRAFAQNVLDQGVRVQLQSGEEVETRKPGWQLGLRLGWSLTDDLRKRPGPVARAGPVTRR